MPKRPKDEGGARPVTRKTLRDLSVPKHDEEGDKEARGRVLVVGGAAEMPGAVVLAAEAALRAGAGKLRIATVASVAPLVGIAVPESRVYALEETEGGAIAPSAAERIAELAGGVDAVVVGPGMIDQDALDRLVATLLPELTRPAIVDAGALCALRHFDARPAGSHAPLVLTPNDDECQDLTGARPGESRHERVAAALALARRFDAIVALKGAETLTVSPDGEAYRNVTGNAGLSTSGSGDVLAGVMAGLLARGASPLAAAVWASYAHGRAAERLARRGAVVGMLARELAAEVPIVLARD